MSTEVNSGVPTKANETFQYTNRFLARTSELIKELNYMTVELEDLLHGIAKLALRAALTILVIFTIYHVVLLVLHALNH